MISAFIVWDSVKPFVKSPQSLIEAGSEYLIDNKFVPLVVVLVTFASMAMLDFIEKKFKQKWLSNFSLGFSMIIGMAVAVLLAL